MRAEERARDVRLVVLDVDGVLTDGGLYYDAQGMALKRFHVQDGLGIKLAQKAGLEIAVTTGLDNPAVAARVRELGIEEYHAGHFRKGPLIRDMAERRGLDFSRMAYLGDDWVDAAPMRLVGLPMAVANAMDRVKDLALWVSTRPGGHGAVREALEFILQAQGRLDELWRSMEE